MEGLDVWTPSGSQWVPLEEQAPAGAQPSGARRLAPRGLTTVNRAAIGGALINVGYRLQDPLEDFDFEHGHDLRPSHIWDGALLQIRLASSVRSRFPRSSRHPLVAVVVCMDARIDTTELMGDTLTGALLPREEPMRVAGSHSIAGDRDPAHHHL